MITSIEHSILSVLVVEDEALIAEEISDRLQRLGYLVAGIADNAESAIEIASRERPDVVLMDISIKGADDGVETARKIYAELDIPVVFLTAHSDEVTFARAMSAASFGYVLKPFHERDLLSAVKVALHRHHTEQYLRDSELTYATIAANVADGIIALDADARVRYLNPAAESMLRIEGADSIGQPLESVLRYTTLTGDGIDAGMVSAVLTSGEPSQNSEWEVLQADGGKLIAEANVTPIRGGGGTVKGAVIALRDITERRRQESALRESEERWQFALEGADDGVWDWDASSNYAYFSPGWKAMLGYAEHEIPGTYEAWESLIHTDDREGVLKSLDELLSGRQPNYAVEHRLRCHDGSYKWVLARGKVVARDAEGAALRIVGTHTDLSEMKEAMHTLQESESRFRALIEDLAVGVVLQDPDDRVTLINRAAKQILGIDLDRDRNIGSSDPRWNLTREDGATLLPEDAPSVIAAKTLVPVRNQVLGACNLETGERKWLLVTAAPRLYEDNLLKHVLVTIADITAQKQTEQALRESDERVRALNERFVLAADSAGIGVWEYNAQSGAVVWDEQMHRLFGLSREDFEGTYKAWVSCIHPDDGAAFHSAMKTAMAGSGFLDIEYRIKLPDNVERHLRACARVLPGKDGQSLRIAGVHIDMTRQRQLERRLLQGQKMQAIGQLAGGVAHDFNNLLTVICGYSDMMLGELMDSAHPLRPFVEAMHEAGERAARLTQQLLLFGRKADQRLETFSLNDLLQDMHRMLRRLIEESIAIEVAPQPDCKSVLADRTQLEQVILNLCLNARDAMPRGGNLVLCTRDATPEEVAAPRTPGDHVVLLVKDDGLGMSPEVKDRLFEPFFTTKGAGQGTGLGMATVYSVVEQAGGFIEIESEPGEGTEVRVYLPVADAWVTAAAAAKAQRKVKGNGETILLVEDEDEVRRVGRLILEQSGFTVIEAESAMEALGKYDAHEGRVDMLVTDVVMPQINGRELAERLRAKKPDLIVLFVSGYNEDAVLRQGISDTTTGFLSKPFSHHEFALRVWEALQKR
ncbi:MAG: PAS domain S-box protein [Candidatus Hydrogenedens sp.]|nr:PAS domain S-box protein [Candidatus Hydrogenedens sp.]